MGCGVCSFGRLAVYMVEEPMSGGYLSRRELERRAEIARRQEVDRANSRDRPDPSIGDWTTVASMSAEATAEWLAGPERPAPMHFTDPVLAAKVEAVMNAVRGAVDKALEQRLDPATMDGRARFAEMMAEAMDGVEGEQTAARIRELAEAAYVARHGESERLLQILVGQLMAQAGVGQ